MTPRGSTKNKVESNCYGRPLTGPCPIQLLGFMSGVKVSWEVNKANVSCEVMKVNLSYKDDINIPELDVIEVNCYRKSDLLCLHGYQL